MQEGSKKYLVIWKLTFSIALVQGIIVLTLILNIV